MLSPLVWPIDAVSATPFVPYILTCSCAWPRGWLSEFFLPGSDVGRESTCHSSYNFTRFPDKKAFLPQQFTSMSCSSQVSLNRVRKFQAYAGVFFGPAEHAGGYRRHEQAAPLHLTGATMMDFGAVARSFNPPWDIYVFITQPCNERVFLAELFRGVV